jgi:hypothetical protein
MYRFHFQYLCWR